MHIGSYETRAESIYMAFYGAGFIASGIPKTSPSFFNTHALGPITTAPLSPIISISTANPHLIIYLPNMSPTSILCTRTQSRNDVTANCYRLDLQPRGMPTWPSCLFQGNWDKHKCHVRRISHMYHEHPVECYGLPHSYVQLCATINFALEPL